MRIAAIKLSEVEDSFRKGHHCCDKVVMVSTVCIGMQVLQRKLSLCCSLPGGVVAQDESESDVVTGPTQPVDVAELIRGDDIDTTQPADEGKKRIHQKMISTEPLLVLLY